MMEDFNPHFPRLPLSVTCPNSQEEKRRRRRRRSSFRITDLPWYWGLIASCMLITISALAIALLRAEDRIDKLMAERASMVADINRLSETVRRQQAPIETVFSVTTSTEASKTEK